LRLYLRGDVGLAARVLQVAMGYDAADPYSRALTLADMALPAAFRFGVPSSLEFCGDVAAEAAFADAITRMQALGGTPVTIDFTPFADAASLLYESALVAERYAAIRTFFDAHEAEVVEPVRSIIAAGRDYSAADLYEAQTSCAPLGQQAATMWQGMDVLLVPTAPTHYTIAAMQADPVALNRNLGAYTNFVNLLDYAALSVPSSMRVRRPAVWHHPDRPLRQRLAAGRAGPALPPGSTGLTQGATGKPCLLRLRLPACRPAPPSRWLWSGPICRACRSTPN
jgi:allophanate hydrolase